MRKVLLAISLALALGMVAGSVVTPSTAQPVDCSKTKC